MSRTGEAAPVRLTDVRGYAAAAALYRSAGWQGTIPVTHRGAAKHPVPEGFTGTHGAWPDEAQVSAWSEQYATHNLGLRLPDDVAGLDVDHYDRKRGADTLAGLEADLGPLPRTWVSTARPGPGGIRLFRIPAGVKLPGTLGAGIDVIQHHHRYIVASPSRHPSGEHYRWISPSGEISDRPPSPEELPDLPPAWLERFGKPGAGVPTPIPTPANGNGVHAPIPAPPAPASAPADVVEQPAAEPSTPGPRGADLHPLDTTSTPAAADVVDVEQPAATMSGWAPAVRRAYEDALLALLGGGSRHDAAVDAVARLTRLEERGHPGASDALDLLEERFVEELTAHPRTGDGERPESEWRRIRSGAAELVKATEATTPPFGEQRFTDVGNAERLVAQHHERLRYVPGWRTWLSWDSRRWRIDVAGVGPQERAKESAKRLAAESLKIDDVKLRQQQFLWAVRSESASAIRATVDMARTSPAILVEHSELDAYPELLCARNGIVDLDSGKLLGHEPGRNLTKLARARWVPDAAAPTWERLLDEALPDDDVRRWFHLVCGLALWGEVVEHILLVLLGDGANGKSTILEAIRWVLGDYAGTCHPELLTSQRFDPHPASLAELAGLRIAIAGELEQESRLAEANVKLLTGGDTLTARRMRQDFWSFVPSHTILLASNHLPAVAGSDLGIWRRLRVIPFTVTVPPERQDPLLPRKLKRERDGILAWLVRGCLEWRRSGLPTPPAGVTVAGEEWRASADAHVDRWLAEEGWILGPDQGATSKALQDSYAEWSMTADVKALSPKGLGKALQRRGCEPSRSHGKRLWRGVGMPPSRLLDT